MTTDEIALCRTLLLSSFDQAPPLILADWYEEHDQYEKALLLRAIAAGLALSTSAKAGMKNTGAGGGYDFGHGRGCGNGRGYGEGYGDANGDGYGAGDGVGDGEGYGHGDGDGYGDGSGVGGVGDAHDYIVGRGYGNGYGHGSG